MELYAQSYRCTIRCTILCTICIQAGQKEKLSPKIYAALRDPRRSNTLYSRGQFTIQLIDWLINWLKLRGLVVIFTSCHDGPPADVCLNWISACLSTSVNEPFSGRITLAVCVAS
jgi:hypothetical protein